MLDKYDNYISLQNKQNKVLRTNRWSYLDARADHWLWATA